MPTRLADIPPENIERNPENPRMHFREAGLNRLAESIDESGGVLVPVYVYPDPDIPDRFRLIDGERRWRMAMRLGLETIPAIVRDGPPDLKQNIVEMFNIHKVREDWEEMPTARALREVMERHETDDPEELRSLTGLSKEQISRFKLVLELPERYQQLIESGDVPMNFFVELDRNVIRPLARNRTHMSERYDAEALRSAFVEKREHGALDDLIDLRKVKPIIQRAQVDAGAPDAESALDAFLRKLFDDPATTIDEVYDASVAFSVEADKLAEQALRLPAQFARLLEDASEGPPRTALLAALRDTRDSLSSLLEEYSVE
ncbi:ParB/RepB/Spo0J family partition protein [Conexibacter sp. SYSU D00693]|uniref:ParB/RepB/Spo0J family partition protein n=1 Tax=Conexibacter sp. SYSU D00693 TaxID=2812560 RepID=UPI00196B35A4|nr:ParB/RepB/Spo0J family partition protein [Conexibacter sp. SYSU D00693]